MGYFALSPLPPVQRIPCPTNTSARTVLIWDLINEVSNCVPGSRTAV